MKSGTSNIIEILMNKIGKQNVLTNTKIVKIIDNGDYISLYDNLGVEYKANKIVSTIPPQIISEHIIFKPELPAQLSAVLHNVQTWMSGSIKFAVEYHEPFWLKNGFSGTIYSQSALASEVYDHCNYENNKFSLMGFLNGSAINYNLKQREKLVTEQIENLFGTMVPKYVSYQEKIWDNEFILSSRSNSLYAHQNNGDALLQKSYMNGKLFFAGTETSLSHPGYLEGSVSSANRIVEIF